MEVHHVFGENLLMNTGMYWHTLTIGTAAKYFEDKYGKTPDEVHVNPSNFQEAQSEVAQSQYPLLNVVPDHSILKGELWIGVHDDEWKIERSS